MCGIVAVLASHPAAIAHLPSMVSALTHRGPDSEGLLQRPEEGVALGMRRLAVLDPSGGDQPMLDRSGRYAVVFNGEVYNFAELRAELEHAGHEFRTSHSDTEVVAEGFAAWGADLFAKLNGMFAICVWDRDTRALTAARDPFGEKPLFICSTDFGWILTSELKAAVGAPGFRRELDLHGLDEYLSFGFSVGPRTLLRDAKKLPPGTSVAISGTRAQYRRYWAPTPSASSTAVSNPAAHLRELLDRSVQARLVADVPVGLFLSGGLDSTSVGYFMAQHSGAVESFSIGFDDPRYDETGYARLAASHLGTRHHVEVIQSSTVGDLVPSVTEMLDEPLADPSAFPTFVLSRLASKHVTVALGGDGSDELLMGYRTHQALKVLRLADPLPRALRASLARLAELPGPRDGYLGKGLRILSTLDRGPEEQLLRRLGGLKGRGRAVLSASARARLSDDVFREPICRVQELLSDGATWGDRVTTTYLRTYLADDILTKVDRASMACSLEVRAPFLDPTLAAFATALPSSTKIPRLRRKHLLREAMRGLLPDAIIDRPKQGFGVPLGTWLRGPLRPLIEEHLAEERLRSQDILSPEAVSRLTTAHMAGRRDFGDELWTLLHFQLWRERWL